MTASVVVSTINDCASDTDGFLDYHANWSYWKLVVFLDYPQHLEYARVKRLADEIQHAPHIAEPVGVKWKISADKDEIIHPPEGPQVLLDSDFCRRDGKDTIIYRQKYVKSFKRETRPNSLEHTPDAEIR